MRPSRSTILLLAALFGLLVLSGCGEPASRAGNAAAESRKRVVAAFYPLAFAAERVAGDGVEVVNLTPAGVEPHDLELTPADVATLRDADLVLYFSGLQPAVDLLAARRSGPSLDVLRIEGLRLLARQAPPGQHAPLPPDPHVWLDPRRFAVVVMAIARELGESERAAPLVAELEALDREMEQGLAHCARREIVTAHAAFGYLAERYGLAQIAIAGWSPEGEVAPRDLERIVARAHAAGATTVFSEPLLSPAVSRTLAREIGAAIAALHPLEVLSVEEERRGEDYFSIQRGNLSQLRKGLACRG